MKIVRLLAAAIVLLAFSQVSSAQVPVTFKATLTWVDNSNNEDGFKVEKSVGGGPFTEIASVGANVLSYVDTGLAPGAAVCYRILAFNVAGKSAPSTAACANTPSVPTAPGTLQIVITVAP